VFDSGGTLQQEPWHQLDGAISYAERARAAEAAVPDSGQHAEPFLDIATHRERH
jgi:hypothetical protein